MVYWKQIYGSMLIFYVPIFANQMMTYLVAKQSISWHGYGVYLFIYTIIVTIASIWFVPMVVAMGGVFFRDVYGLKRVEKA